jgi:hypothetical protein
MKYQKIIKKITYVKIQFKFSTRPIDFLMIKHYNRIIKNFKTNI